MYTNWLDQLQKLLSHFCILFTFLKISLDEMHVYSRFVLSLCAAQSLDCTRVTWNKSFPSSFLICCDCILYCSGLEVWDKTIYTKLTFWRTGHTGYILIRVKERAHPLPTQVALSLGSKSLIDLIWFGKSPVRLLSCFTIGLCILDSCQIMSRTLLWFCCSTRRFTLFAVQLMYIKLLICKYMHVICHSQTKSQINVIEINKIVIESVKLWICKTRTFTQGIMSL